MSNEIGGIPRPSTRSKYDALLDQYFPQRANNWIYQSLENTTDSLLLALLIEMQMQNRGSAAFPGDDRPEHQEAEYFTTEAPLAITSHRESEQTLNWGFPARSVMVWGFDEPIRVSFRQSGDHRKIPLDPGEADPFVPAPEGGLNSSMARFSLPDSDSSETQVKVAAFA
ncbi:hypothetical protein OB905_11750 [Halobacteria archaeon AArc-dxtr1]|nr:hypothetical protein [Halobacteria archaeon AArc-dxtr1]